MNLGELRDAFRRDTQDIESPYLWSDESIAEWANEAEQEAAIRAHLLHERADSSVCQIDVSANESRYDLHNAVTEIVYASLTDTAGTITILSIQDWREADRLQYDRRTDVRLPTAIIHHDTWIDLDCLPDAAYTLNMEVYRLPLRTMSSDSDAPEISAKHHKQLLHWIKHKAYAVQDADGNSESKSKEFETRFERHFGVSPDSSLRKRQNANTPHRNKAVW